MSQQINLFNPIFLKQKKYFSAVTMAQALGLILLGSGLMGAYADFQLAQLRPETNAVSAQLEADRVQLVSVNTGQAARKKDMTLDADVRRLEAEVFALQRVSHTLSQGEAGNADGYSRYMQAFSRQIIDGLWLTGFSIAGGGKEIAISGRALRPELVPAYLNRLGNEPTMLGKPFGALEMHSGRDPQSPTAAGQPAFVAFSLHSSEGARTEGAPAGGRLR